MKASAFKYHDPHSLIEALDLLASLENTIILAGGQSLVPMMNFRMVTPDHLIDINRLRALSSIELHENSIKIGAMTRQRDLEFSPLIDTHLPVIQEALQYVGHRQTRNRGTLGGSLCHLDPSAELVAVCALMDAVLHVQSKNGARDVPINLWGQGLMTHSMQPGEMLVGITISPWQGPHGYSFVEFARRHGDFALVAVACLLRISANGTISDASLCLSGTDSSPLRVSSAEQILIGNKPSHEVWRAASEEAAKLKAINDPLISQKYRQHLARILSYRALEIANERALKSQGRHYE